MWFLASHTWLTHSIPDASGACSDTGHPQKHFLMNTNDEITSMFGKEEVQGRAGLPLLLRIPLCQREREFPSLHPHNLGGKAVLCHQRGKELTDKDRTCSRLQAQALPIGSLKAWQIPSPTCKPRQVPAARDRHQASDAEDVGLSTLSPSHACVHLQKQLLSAWRGWG